MQNDPVAAVARGIAAAVPASLPVGAAGSAGATLAAGPGGGPFAGVFQDALANLSGLEEQAVSMTDGLVAGRGVDIHAAMIATQKSDLAFEMALAVRGKLVSAYQTMMGVQF